MTCPGIAVAQDRISLLVDDTSAFDKNTFCSSKFFPKEGNDPKYGKGACFIITNFTGDAQRHQLDADRISEFHKTRLNFNAVFMVRFGKYCMTNLTRRQFFALLDRIQRYLNNMPDIDRFFLYILSHGDRKGILMCKEGSGSEVDRSRSGKKKRVKLKDIVKRFSHDQVESLKGYPKVFIVQCYTGDELPCKPFKRTSNVNSCFSNVPTTLQWKTTLGLDTIVCVASYCTKLGWVSGQGSLFFRSFLHYMGTMSDSEEYSAILRRVADDIFMSEEGAEIFYEITVNSGVRKFYLT